MPSSARAAAAANINAQSREMRFIRGSPGKEGAVLLQHGARRQGMLRRVPLRAAQLFVRCNSLDELGDALGRALEKKPQQDRSFLALHDSGWGTVVGDVASPALARLLSERFGSTLFLELDAAAF